MNKKEAWSIFKKTGLVADYLQYTKIKKCENNDNKSRGNDY